MQAVTGGTAEALTVENDPDAAKTLVNEFVESYNALIQTFDSLTSYDAEKRIGRSVDWRFNGTRYSRPDSSRDERRRY